MPRFLTCAFVVVLFSLHGALATLAEGFTTTHLRCEYRENPLGIDTKAPRLGWRMESDTRGVSQSAYRIRVASTADKLAAGEADLWDSGKVQSNQTLHIVYAGKPLVSRQECFWTVQAWDEKNQPGDWSAPAMWSMGVLVESDWQADYISYKDDEPIATDTKSLYLPAARQYRKEFVAVKKIKRATVYATALGIYELHLNGQCVSDNFFAPGWTDYRQRAYYNTYDVTSMLAAGDNAIGA